MTLPYTHLTLAERREIYRLRSAQIPVAVIAPSRAVSSSRPATPLSSVRRRSQLAPASVTGKAT